MKRRIITTLCAALPVTLLAAPALAQSVDIVEQNVLMDISGADTTITIDVALEATGNASSFDMYALGMPIVSADVDGVPAEVGPHPQYPTLVQRLTYPTALASGDAAQVRIVIAGTPSCDAYSGSGVVCMRTPEQTVFTPPQPGSAWYLTNLYEIDTFVGTVTVAAPDTHLVVAGQGAATEVTTSGGIKTWTFGYQQPTESVGVWAAAGEVAKSGDGAVEAYYSPDGSAEPDKISRAAEISSQLLPIYEELYGKLPFSPAHILAVPKNFAFAGMGLMGNVFVGEYVFGTHDYLLEQGMAHEFAHTWWGGLASGADPNEGAFLNEAFAEYSAWRALGMLQGEAVRTAGVRMNAVWYMYRRPGDDDIAVLDPNVYDSPLYVFVTYHKGSVFLRTLEQAVGAEAYTEALRAFVARGYGAVSVNALVEDIATASGYDAAADVDRWLHETGFPKLTVASEARPTAEGGVEVVLHLDSQGAFDYRAPVRLVAGDGSYAESEIQIVAGQSEHVLAGGARPVSVELDPTWTLVREVRPVVAGDVTLDGVVDGADLIEIALRDGRELPEERRVDGGYDPLYDVDANLRIDGADLDAALASAAAGQ